MSDLNKAMLIGNIGKDPEIRMTQSNKPVANVVLATSEVWTDPSGQKKERTEWHDLVFFDRKAEIIEQYAFKGQQLYVEGTIRTRSWDGNDGQKKYRTEINVSQFLFSGQKIKGLQGAKLNPSINLTRQFRSNHDRES